MRFTRASDARRHEPVPGLSGRVVHGETMTIVTWDLPAGTEIPLHEHAQEQILRVVSGAIQLTVAAQSRRVGPGDTVVIPPRVPHEARTLERTRLIDVFHPVRTEVGGPMPG